MKDSFVHLHVHTQYSLLDGAGKVEDYFKKAAEDGMPALAVTDHGNLHAWPEMFRIGAEYGVKATPGCELYIEPEAMGFNRKEIRSMNKAARDTGDGETGKQYFHQTTLAMNEDGYLNLMKMQSRSWLDNYYYKPLSSLEMLDKYSKGVIATSSCLGGVPLQHIMRGQIKEAEQFIGQMVDIYGPDRYFIELQRHNIKEQDETNPVLLDIAKKFDLKVIATNDCHYNNCDDHASHDALLCVQTRAKIHDTDRFKFSGDPGTHALKTSAEMRALFSDLDPSVCDNTLLIAEMCDDISFGHDGYRMPHFDLPEGFSSEEDYLRHIAFKGAQYRWGKDLTNEQVERLEYELGIICSMGFAGYFLILWDLCKYARSRDILVGPGRGSACGSAVAYSLLITGIDPLQYDLLFERFLNPDRVSMPDIDLDFDTRYREELINYTADKYGKDRVAQIVTFAKIKARSAIRDSARVLDKDFATGNAINSAMPDLIHGRDTPLWVCMADEAPTGWEQQWRQAKKLRQLYNKDNEVREVIDVAKGLEGLARSTGVHAAAVIIGDAPLENYIPLMKGKDDQAVSQWSMGPVEDLGLVKMDYLGLRNLDVISDTLRMLKDTRDICLRIDEIPLDDSKTYDMLSKGKGVGVFQFENSGMRNLMSEIKPNSIEDLSALTALYRPGPLEMNMHTEFVNRRNGTKQISLLHQDAEPILRDTLGVLTYQESVMRIAQKFAGYSLAGADNLRKIVGKKKLSAMNAEKERFVQGCIDTGYGEDLGNKWWALIEPFGSYGFNKCFSGDTEVVDGSCSSRTIKEIYDRINNILPPTKGKGPKSELGKSVTCLECKETAKKLAKSHVRGLCKGCYSWHQKFHGKVGLTILAYDESDGRIRPAKLKNVYSNGVKPVFEIVLADGKRLKSTNNHRHRTSTGDYVATEDLLVGDSLTVSIGVDLVSGMSLQDMRTTEGVRLEIGSVNGQKGALNYGFVDGGFSKFKTNSAKLEHKCGHTDESCAGRLEVAHLDGDRTNNELSNLSNLCVSHHKRHDYAENGRKRRFDKGHLAGVSEIISIEYVGDEETYDVEMDSVYHNLLANGIVSHNSHAVAYGFISYITAYLKVNYSAEYFSALLNSVDKIEKAGGYIVEAKAMGLDVQPPNINKSRSEYFPEGNTVYVGFSAIKGVGDKPGEQIVQFRDKLGRDFTDFMDFVRNGPRQAKNKGIVEALIKAGAFDEMHTRGGLLTCFQAVLEGDRGDSKYREAGVISLGDSLGQTDMGVIEVPNEPMDRAMRLKLEKELLGTYVSEHPLDGMVQLVEDNSDISIEDFLEEEGAWEGRICGVVTSLLEKPTRKGDDMAWVTLGDLTASTEVLIFPRVWAKQKLSEGDIVSLEGNTKPGENKFFANSVKHLSERKLTARPISQMPAVLIRVHQDSFSDLTQEEADSLKALFTEGVGSNPVLLTGSKDGKVLSLGEKFPINPNPKNIIKLKSLAFVEEVVTNVTEY